ncbi:MAG: hypothetical protein QOE31_2082 [Solirubrobacteraceae bacterium]|jgi:membrane protein DedA with SNARE-associated domain|nr:hypothetical protein [Solirubrobacteraceae bacterium]
MQEIFKGFLKLRLLGSIPLLIVIALLVGVSAIARGSDVLGIAILAVVPIVVVALLGWVLTRRARERPR